jgi:precorrin-6B methylase 1
MIKKIGLEIDDELHSQFLFNFTQFIENFSPALDTAQQYQNNIHAEKIVTENLSPEKEKIVDEIVETLKSMIPLFLNVTVLENKLEKLNK